MSSAPLTRFRSTESNTDVIQLGSLDRNVTANVTSGDAPVAEKALVPSRLPVDIKLAYVGDRCCYSADQGRRRFVALRC